MRVWSFSLEALVGVFVGLVVGLIEMSWEFRSFGVLIAIGLAIHIAKRLGAEFWAKIAVAIVAIGILILGTARPIWTSFHADFPEVTGDTVLSRIVMFGALAACCLAGYIFLIRPRGREGYRVLPAQLIAFGACMIMAGLVPLVIGLGWQLRQNWVYAGVTPTGAPVLPLAPLLPQITQAPALPALPPPAQQSATEQAAPQFFSGYNLTETSVNALGTELFKIRDALSKRIELNKMSTDGSSGPLVGNIFRACDLGGVDCPINNIHPNTPTERGPMIYVADPAKAPESAKKLQFVLQQVGINAPLVTRSGFGPDSFSLFIAPAP